MSTAAVETPATPAEPVVEISGTKQDILDALDLEPETPEERPAETDDAEEPTPAETPAGKTKVEEPPAEGDEAKAAKDGEEVSDDDAAVLKAINARSRKRHLERQRAAAKPAPAAQPAPAATTSTQQPAASPAPRAKTEVETAVEDVLKQIAALSGADAEAATAQSQGEKPDTTQAERNAALNEIKTKLDAIAKVADKTGELDKQVTDLKGQLQALEDARVVQEHYANTLTAMADELPALTARADAMALLDRGVEKFFEKYKQPPDVRELARRIERKLTAAKPERTGTEKHASATPAPRRTVSNSLGSPPAARTGPDTRTAEQADADFNARFGLE